MQRFGGKVIFVTGAASGIGRATAIRLASEGGSVYGVDVDTGALEETARLREMSPIPLAGDEDVLVALR